jgi:hypothetical protein
MLEDVQRFWLSELDFPQECLRKCQVNMAPTSSSGLKKGKHPYGVVRIQVCRTDVVQEMYGAIQKFGDFDRVEWL